MTFELCKGSSQYLIDVTSAKHWRTARTHFKKEGYEGKFLLIEKTKTSFFVYNIKL